MEHKKGRLNRLARREVHLPAFDPERHHAVVRAPPNAALRARQHPHQTQWNKKAYPDVGHEPKLPRYPLVVGHAVVLDADRLRDRPERGRAVQDGRRRGRLGGDVHGLLKSGVVLALPKGKDVRQQRWISAAMRTLMRYERSCDENEYGLSLIFTNFRCSSKYCPLLAPSRPNVYVRETSGRMQALRCERIRTLCGRQE